MEDVDFESFKSDALAKLKAGEGVVGKGGAFTPLLKAFLEEALKGELADRLSGKDHPNRKNAKGIKTKGSFTLMAP